MKIEDLAERLGVSKSEAGKIGKILNEVFENNKKLDSCSRHYFEPINRNTNQPLKKPEIFCKWKCKYCGGTVDSTARNWYLKGAEHHLQTK